MPNATICPSVPDVGTAAPLRTEVMPVGLCPLTHYWPSHLKAEHAEKKVVSCDLLYSIQLAGKE